jgi:hypothetical protein
VSEPPGRECQVFDLQRYLLSLSRDAAEVAMMVLRSCPDLDTLAAVRGGGDKAVRAALREVLRDWGWSRQRVNEAFEEVRLS